MRFHQERTFSTETAERQPRWRTTMSRVQLDCKDEDNYLIVGLDPPLGEYFYQLYGPMRTVVEEDGQEWEDDSPIVWACTATRTEVLEMIGKHCDMGSEWTDHVYNLIVMDLDPGEAMKNRSRLVGPVEQR
jgi:hypothetical protein